MASAVDFIKHLNEARRLALADPALYTQVLPGVLGAIGTGAALPLRRWGADFLAECFGSPTLGADEKTRLAVQQFPTKDGEPTHGILETVRDYLEKETDAEILKGAVVCAASLYPLVLRWIIQRSNDSATWQKMAAIKMNILRRMDSESVGVRICCIKFVQKVVQTQTPGMIADPRRPDQNEISLALVPRDHPLIPPTHLEAEASGLLDRLLSLLQENISEAILITSTLNSMGVLIRTRASISNKIISAILSFDPFRLAGSHPPNSKAKVYLKSMERTTRSLLLNTLKRNPNHPLAQRIQAYLDRLQQNHRDFFEDSRKRSAPNEPIDGLDIPKRQRLGASILSTGRSPPPLPPGPISFAQLFTLTHEEGSRAFDVSAIPHELVIKILLPLLHRTDPTALNSAINEVRSRYLSLGSRPAGSGAPAVQAPGAEDEDDDYEPDFEPAEDTEQLLNKLDTASTPIAEYPPADLAAIGPFKLPAPAPMTQQEATAAGKATVSRLISLIGELDDQSAANGLARAVKNGAVVKGGFNRLAASSNDRDSWVTILTRIATRTSLPADPDFPDEMKAENGTVAKREHEAPIPEFIRDSLFRYIVEDFRRRIGVAIQWLCEEWYSDRVLSGTALPSYRMREDQTQTAPSTPNYDRWTLRILDAIIPYLDAKDGKVVIMFLSEVPVLSDEMLARVKTIARDPERVNLVIHALHYLILFKPPVKEAAVDCLVDLWANYDDARNAAAKLLAKFKPEVLQQPESRPESEMEDDDPPEPPRVAENGHPAAVKAE